MSVVVSHLPQGISDIDIADMELYIVKVIRLQKCWYAW